MDTKSCTVCGAIFAKPQTASRKVWDAREFCSRGCFHESRRKGPETKSCVRCGAVFERKRLTNAAWTASRYCSTACAYADRKGTRTGAEHWAWKGGRREAQGGYIEVSIPDGHPMASMRRNHRYVMEHRLVLAESLGRPLERHETVHHINGDRQDNRLENLQLRSGRHGRGIAFTCRACGSHDIEAREI